MWCGDIFKSRTFGGWVIWNIRVCVNIMPVRKDISNYPRETIVVAYQGHLKIIIIKNHHSTLRKIIGKWITFKTVVNLPKSGVPVHSPQGQNFDMRNHKEPKSQMWRFAEFSSNLKMLNDSIQKRPSKSGHNWWSFSRNETWYIIKNAPIQTMVVKGWCFAEPTVGALQSSSWKWTPLYINAFWKHLWR